MWWPVLLLTHFFFFFYYLYFFFFVTVETILVRKGSNQMHPMQTQQFQTSSWLNSIYVLQAYNALLKQGNPLVMQ